MIHKHIVLYYCTSFPLFVGNLLWQWNSHIVVCYIAKQWTVCHRQFVLLNKNKRIIVWITFLYDNRILFWGNTKTPELLATWGEANFHLTLFIQQFAIVLVNLFKQWKSKFFVITVLVFLEQKRLLWTLVYEKQCTYLLKPKHQCSMSRIQSKNLSKTSSKFERSWMENVIPIRNSFRIYM